MKTTTELPAQLMSEVERLAAREQRKVEEFVAELVRAGLERHTRPTEQGQQQSAEQWLAEWFELADEVMNDAPPGSTAREILEEDRNRLERR